jgi:DNA-binding CsgD family transcriptional regulator
MINIRIIMKPKTPRIPREERAGRPSRSSHYQVLFCETSVPNEMLESFPNEESVYKRLNPFSYNDEIAELEEQLKEEFWRVVEQLTERQKKVLKLLAKGNTQMEVAKELGVNQSSITKSVHGNTSYDKGKPKVSYGGSKKRLKALLNEDPKIQDILRRIADLRGETFE